MKAEERAKGRVDRRLYKTYLAAWGPFFAIPLFMVSLAISERGLQVKPPDKPVYVNALCLHMSNLCHQLTCQMRVIDWHGVLVVPSCWLWLF